MSLITTKYPHLVAILRPSGGRSVSEWSDDEVWLSPRDSAEHERYRTSRTPYIREPQDSFKLDYVRQITMVFPTQIGKTRAQLNMLSYGICERPAPTLYVLPTEKESLKFSRNRVQPMFSAMPLLKGHLRASPRDLKTLEYQLDNCQVLFAWSNSPATLASSPICYIFLDEVAKFPLRSKDEADPVSLAGERVRTFVGQSKIVCASTPKTSDDLIMREWGKSDQRLYHVPCPRCGKEQELRFPQVRWPKSEREPDRIRGAQLAWYECAHGGGRIEEQEKGWMVEQGVWRPAGAPGGATADNLTVATVEADPSHVGFQLNCLVSPWLTFSDVAAKFLETKDDRGALQNFKNSWLAEPWEERVSGISEKVVIHLGASDRERGVLPAGTQLVTAGVDWHGLAKGFYWAIWAWTGPRNQHLVDWGHTFEIDALMSSIVARELSTAGGRLATQPFVGVDAGYETPRVYEYCRPLYPRVRPTKGDPHLAGQPIRPSPVDYTRGKKRYKGFSLLLINTGFFKDMLVTALGEDSLGLPAGVEESFLRSLAAEHKVREPNGKEIWKQCIKGSNNHWLDATVIAWAVGELHGASRLQPPREAGEKRTVPAGPRMGPGRHIRELGLHRRR